MTTYPELFFTAADREPGALALEGGHRAWTYGELAAAVRRLAGRLAADGVGPSDLVAVISTPGARGIVGLLAVMAAGGAYVALDPRDPPERLRHIADAAGVRLTLLGDDAAGFPPHGRTLTIDTEIGAHAGAARSTPTAPQPEDLAYVCFTSGSTGRPRGVMVEHRQLVNYIQWVASMLRAGNQAVRLPALTRLSFDASVMQVLAPLARGDSVWLVDPDLARHPDRLLAALRARPDSGLHCVPSLWRLILPLVEPAEPPRLAALFLGGELVDEKLWADTRTALGQTRLANVYGPTETTVQASGGFQEPGEPLHAGRPADGVRIEIVDDRNRPLPAGERGRILIGGAGVARGYLNDPEATAAAFALRVGPTGSSERWYSTGDDGWLDSEGRLYVTGRRDRQVKVRGHRVELAEVESLLRSAGAAEAAAVLLPTSDLGAVVVASEELESRLREALARIAPAVMIPSRLAAVAKIPCLFNGKPDYVAVAALLTDSPPTPYTETTLEHHWCRLLGMPEVADDDDFFALGGHSLTASQLTAAARVVTGRNVSLRLIFDNPSFGAWSAAVRRAETGLRRPGAAVRSPHARVLATVQQLALWPVERALRDTPVNTLALPLWLDDRPSSARLRRLADFLQQRHDALRSVLEVDRDGVWLRDAGLAPIEIETHAADGQADILAWAARLARRPVSPLDGPALRLHLVTHADRSLLLVLTSHLVADGRSLQVLAADVGRLLAGDRPVETASSYLTYAAAQAEEDRVARVRRAEEALADRIGRTSRRAQLPGGSGKRTHRLATWTSPLPPVDPELRTTPFVVLLAAVAAAAGEPGQAALLGTVLENRSADDQDAVGLFATSAQLAIEVHEDSETALARARRELVNALDSDPVPPELLSLPGSDTEVIPVAALTHIPAPAELPGPVRLVQRREYAHLPQPVTPTAVPWFVTVRDDDTCPHLDAEYDEGAVGDEVADECGRRLVSAWSRLSGQVVSRE